MYEWHRFKELQPEAALDEAQASFACWGDPTSGWGFACVILSDVVGSAKNNVRNSGSRGKLTGEQTSADGRKLEWYCETSDGKTGSVKINGQAYELGQGSLFLVATKGAELRVLQLKRDTLSLKVGNDPKDGLERLIRGDEEIGPFFAKAAKAK